MQLFSPQKVEKTTLKSGSEILIFFSSLLPWAAQTAQMCPNVAYRPTVYKTGTATILIVVALHT